MANWKQNPFITTAEQEQYTAPQATVVNGDLANDRWAQIGLPFLQAVAWAFVITLPVWAVACVGYEWEHWGKATVITFSFAMPLTYGWRTLHWDRWVEKVTGWDVSDYQPGGTPPPAPEQVVRFEVKKTEGSSSRAITGSLDKSLLLRLQAVAGQLVRDRHNPKGLKFSENKLAEGPHKIYSGTEFELVRDELLARGFAVWRNDGHPRQGIEFTEEGWTFLTNLPSTNLNDLDTY